MSIRKYESASQGILHDPFWNKGTAFTLEERQALKVEGLLPFHVESIELQQERALRHLRDQQGNINKCIYVNSLKDRNTHLFYRLLMDNLEEVMPIVYTPTVGEACEKFALNYRTAEGMYFNNSHRGRILAMLDNWPHKEVDIIVVTDGSRILGLGDLGSNGMGIPIGKLSLYVAAGGFHPTRTLPILIDTGTDNEKLLADPLYLGCRHKRLGDDEYYPLMEEFLTAVKAKWPKCLVQFEDFSNQHAFSLLDKYRNRLLCFNDDIQGTGAVVAAGYLNAVRMSGVPVGEQRLVFLGAGSAGIGVADAICRTIVHETGCSLDKARAQFYFIDSKGLITANRGDTLADVKVPYARSDNGDFQSKDLVDILQFAKATTLIGLAGRGRAFFEKEIRALSAITARPIIFALSNPTRKAECTAEDAYSFSDGKAIFASGSPFDPVVYNGKTFYPGQGNNMLVFPGLGFGAVLAHAEHVTEKMVAAATRAVATSLTDEEIAQGRTYPTVDRIRTVSFTVAKEVMIAAYEEGVARAPKPADMDAYIQEHTYHPDYAHMTALDL